VYKNVLENMYRHIFVITKVFFKTCVHVLTINKANIITSVKIYTTSNTRLICLLFSSVGEIPNSFTEGFDNNILPCASHRQFKLVLQVRIEIRIPIQNNKTVTKKLPTWILFCGKPKMQVGIKPTCHFF